MERGEHDGAEPDDAVHHGAAMAAVHAVLGGQSVALLGAGDDVGQGHVRDEEAVEDLRLEAEPAELRRHEATQVLDGVLPLAALHQAPQVPHGEAGVRLAGHPARTYGRGSQPRTVNQRFRGGEAEEHRRAWE